MGCNPFIQRSLIGRKDAKSPGKYVDRSLEDLKDKDKLYTAPLYSLHRTFRTLLMVSVYNHQQIIPANCFWWIAPHLWDVSWKHSPFSEAPLLAQHFKHWGKSHVWSRFGLKQEHFDTELQRDTWCLSCSVGLMHPTKKRWFFYCDKIYQVQNITVALLQLTCAKITVFEEQLHKRIILNLIS